MKNDCIPSTSIDVDLDFRTLSLAIPDLIFPPSREKIIEQVSELFVHNNE